MASIISKISRLEKQIKELRREENKLEKQLEKVRQKRIILEEKLNAYLKAIESVDNQVNNIQQINQ
jgi:chromosome segregation ATPase